MDGIKTVGVIAVIDVLCTASAPLNFHHLSTLCSAPQVHQSGTQIQSESLRLAPPQLCPTSYLVELLPCTASPYTCHLHLHLPPTPTTHAYTHTYHPRLHPHLPPTPTPTPTTHDYTHTYHLHLHLHRASLRSCVLINTRSPGPGVGEAVGMGVRGSPALARPAPPGLHLVCRSPHCARMSP
jgi:hypothetical protein